MRIGSGRASAVALAILVSACIDARTRPLTSVETREPRTGSVAVITHPIDGQRFLEQTWVTGSGVQVTYAGTFRDGDQLRVLAFLDFAQHSETQPFHVTSFTIAGDPDKATFVRGNSDRFRDAVGVTILLEIHDPQGFLVSADSVNTEIQ